MATTVEVGNIQARITATTGRFDSVVRRVNSRLGSVKTSSKSLQDRIKSLNRSFDDLYQRLERVSQVGGRMQKWFGGFLAAQTAAVTVALKQAASYANEAKAVAGQTGIAVESIQALSYAVQQSDGDIGLLNTGLRALARRSAEAAQGNRTFAKYFERLGVRVQNVDGSMRPLEDILMDVADAVQALGSESEASAALMGLMGDAGRQLVPFMRQGSAGIRELMREARSLGLVMDREAVHRLSALSDQLNRTRLGLGAISREWALTFLPVAERIVSRIDSIVRAFHSLDDRQKELVFRFGTLTAAAMTAGFAFSTFLVILPQLVRGLQITMNVMAVFASPWVLGIAAIVAAVILLKKAWDQNLGGVQDKTESVTSAVIQAWGDVETKIQSLKLDIPVPEWDKTIDTATASVAQAWDEAKATIEALPPITLPAVEWPTIDTEPLKAEWERVRQEIASLEAPPIPAGVETWIDRVTESLKRSPGGQVVLNIGELAQEVMAGEKPLHDAVLELLGSNLSVPFTALLWTLAPIGTGWKLTLTAAMLALNFLPDADLSIEGLNRLIGNVSERISQALTGGVTIGGETIQVAGVAESVGNALGQAIGEGILFAFDLLLGVLGLPAGLDTRAYELGRAIAQQIVGPFTRGFFEGLLEASRRAAETQRRQETQQMLFELGFAPGRTREVARELAQQLEGREIYIQQAPPLTIWQRIGRALGFQQGTPWTGWGPTDEVAGVVHRREAVIPWDVLRRGPAAVLEFLGAPGFQEGKLGAPLGVASVQSQAGELKRQNEEALSELQRMGGLLSGLSERWDEVNTKLAAMAEDTPILRDLVELVRILVELTRASGAPAGTPDLTEPPAATPQTLRDRIATMIGRGLAWLKEQGAAAGEQLRQFSATVGQALTPVGILTSLLNALSEPVEALLVPITMVVSALSQALLPVFKATFPIIKTFGVLLLTVLQGVSTVWNAIVGTIGGIFKALSQISILGLRPLKFLEGTANFFLGLQVDTKALADAQKELRDLTWEEAMARIKNTDALNRATEALRNVPSGFKVALARFQAATPVQSFASGGYVPATPGGRIVRVAEGGEGEYIVPESKMGVGDIIVHVNVQGNVYGEVDIKRVAKQAVGEALRQQRMAAYGVT